MLLIGATILARPLPVHAADGDKPGVEACASASESAQTLLDSHKLLAARAKLLVCARTSCPAVIKRDCDELLSHADAAIPTIVLSLKDAGGRDVTDAKVLLDGVALSNALQGQAVPLDPGSHTLRFERAGSSPLDLPVVAHEGEHAREVLVQLAAAAPSRETAQAAVPTSPSASSSSAPSWAAWTLGGVGVVALGTFAYLAANGQSQYDQCKASGCSAGESASLGRERAFGFASLGVGVAASAASAWLFIKNPGARRDGTSARLGVGATPAGTFLRVDGSF
jgi:hypothetical protein